MKTVAFELSMPHCGSWNGHWSGENQKHLMFQRMSDRLAAALDGQSWDYRWDDGWSAVINARVVDATEARKLRKQNAGFCGYEWMVKSILSFGRIEHHEAS